MQTLHVSNISACFCSRIHLKTGAFFLQRVGECWCLKLSSFPNVVVGSSKLPLALCVVCGGLLRRWLCLKGIFVHQFDLASDRLGKTYSLT